MAVKKPFVGKGNREKRLKDLKSVARGDELKREIFGSQSAAALYIRYFNKALHVLFIFIVKHKEMRSDSRLFHNIVHLILMTISYTLLHNTLEISVDDKLKLSVSTTVECWIQYSVHLRALLVPY